MALTKELLYALNNEDEALPKRLRIANNAFNSTDFYITNKEGILLEWLTQTGLKLELTDSWNILQKCLTSSHMKDIKQNDIRQDILSNIINAVSNRLKQELNADLRNAVLQCALSLLRIDIFQQYFRHDIKGYSIFVSLILNNIDSFNEMNNVMEDNLLFSTKILLKQDSRKCFLSYTLDALSHVLMKFNDSKMFEMCTKLVQKIVFPLNSKDSRELLEQLFKHEQKENVLSNELLDSLIQSYKKDNEESKILFKLLFTAFWNAHKNEKLLLYKFYILLLEVIGFNVKQKFAINLPDHELDFDLEKSLLILSEIFVVINNDNLPSDIKVNDISFSNCVENVVSSMIRSSTQPNIYILKILKILISLEPLVIDNILNEILPFIMLPIKNDEEYNYYNDLMLSLYDMYLKLHRLDIFVKEMLISLKYSLYTETEKREPVFIFKNKYTKQTLRQNTGNVRIIFPESIVHYFHKCIILQPSKQVISIMQTLLSTLDGIVSDIQNCINDPQQILFFQIVGELTNQFLSAVRIAEHTTPEKTVREFIKDLIILKEILAKLGTSLLKIEHNHLLMCSFLNISYIWAEIIILLIYYKPVDDINYCMLSNDNATSNITYIHNYLTGEQWSLVSQRIKNFGEQPCKLILQKLIIQKVRAVILFGPTVTPDVQVATLKCFTSDVVNNWKILLTEEFLLKTAVPKLENHYVLKIAECVVTDILNTEKMDILKKQSLADCRKMTTAILYVCMSKMNGLFKAKRKMDDTKKLKFFSTKVFKNIDFDSFICADGFDLTKICTLYDNTTITEQIFEIDCNRFLYLCEMIKNLPVIFFPGSIQIAFFSYILSVCIDLKHSGQQNNKCLELGEQFLIGILENKICTDLILTFPIVKVIELILNNLNRYHEILSFVINQILKENDTVVLFQPVVDMLVKNLPEKKYLEISTLTLDCINKVNEFIKCETNKKCIKKYKIKLCKYLAQKVLSDKKIEDMKIEPFVFTLQKYLLKDTKGRLDPLKGQLTRYINYSIRKVNPTNAKGCLLLVQLVLSNQKKLDKISPKFMVHAWRICRNLKYFNRKIYYLYNKTISLLFKNASDKQFVFIVKDISTLTIKFMQSGQLEEFNNALNLWNSLFNFTYSKRRQECVYKALCSLLERSILYMSDNHNQVFNEAFIKLEMRLIANKQVSQAPNIIDIYFQTVYIIMSREYDYENLTITVKSCYALMDSLIKYKKALMTDRLASYLMLARLFFKQICNKSNSDFQLNEINLKNMTDCAFLLEKLLRNIKSFKQDVARVIPYLIADILNYYEKISLYPAVKAHINNGLYEVIDLCDSHAITYLLRTLSVASTEIFKTIYENYKKYYKFTGKI